MLTGSVLIGTPQGWLLIITFLVTLGLLLRIGWHFAFENAAAMWRNQAREGESTPTQPPASWKLEVRVVGLLALLAAVFLVAYSLDPSLDVHSPSNGIIAYFTYGFLALFVGQLARPVYPHLPIVLQRLLTFSVIAGITITILVAILLEAGRPLATLRADQDLANWLAGHVDTYSLITADRPSEAVRLLLAGEPDKGAATWRWLLMDNVSEQDPGNLIGNSFHYLIMDERASRQPFSERIAVLSQRKATLLYETDNFLGLGGRRAVFWTFRADHLVNLSFNGELFLQGYNLEPTPDGGIALLFHWYTLATPMADYHYFLHIVDPQTGKLLGQNDGALGKGVHPTSQWRHAEIVFEQISLPGEMVLHLPSELSVEFGLYDLKMGQRARIISGNQTLPGDSVTWKLAQQWSEF